MKKFCKIFTELLFLSIFVIIVSCNSKHDTKSQLETLYEELKENSDEYTTDDWEAAIAQMNDIDNMLKKYQSDYSEEELKEIGRLKGLCLALFTKYSVHSFKDQMKNVMKEAEGFFEGFTKGLTDEEQ